MCGRAPPHPSTLLASPAGSTASPTRPPADQPSISVAPEALLLTPRSLNAQAAGWSAAWSPDGTRLAFQALDGTISTVSADGSGAVQSTGLQGFGVTWAFDGTRLAFARGPQEGVPNVQNVWVMNVDGSAAHAITAGANAAWPDWSPVSDRIAFVAGFGIAAMNADGSGIGLLTEGQPGFIAQGPAFSPDGTKIAFFRTTSAGSDVFVVNADGSGLQQVTSTGGARDPDW